MAFAYHLLDREALRDPATEERLGSSVGQLDRKGAPWRDGPSRNSETTTDFAQKDEDIFASGVRGLQLES